MQPHNSNTGYDQQTAGGQGIPEVPHFPTPSGAAPLLSANHSPQPSPAADPGTPEGTWVDEVQQVMSANDQDPKKRATAMAAIRARYQQQVLGLKPRTKAE